MLDDLKKKGYVTEQNYLNARGQVHYKEMIAGKTSSVEIAHLTGYTDVYVRLVVGGFRRLNPRNVAILQAIERVATGYETVCT